VSRLEPLAALGALLSIVSLQARPQSAAPPLDDVLRRMGDYVASYGERAALFVAVEKYTQMFMSQNGGRFAPRRLVAELALVKAEDEGDWMGFRDVVEVNGKRVADRDDRLRTVLTRPGGTVSAARRLADESSRFNVGPVIRNFNVPTTALFFLSAVNQPRFAFKFKGEEKVDGVRTWEIAFRETRRPTLVRTRAGKDVPCEGTVWVLPADGKIVRTRLSLRGFADVMSQGDPRAPSVEPAAPVTMGTTTTTPASQAPAPQPDGNTGGTGPGTSPPASPPGGSGNTGGSGTAGTTSTTTAGTSATSWPPDPGPARRRWFDSPLETTSLQRIESEAVIEVTYQRDDRFAMWLPARVLERYAGAIQWPGRAPVLGESRTKATYSEYKRFETSARIVEPDRR